MDGFMNRFFRICSLVVFATVATNTSAQNISDEQRFRERINQSQGAFSQPNSIGDYDKEFKEFLNEQQRRMEEFRNRQNAEFAEFMKKAWEPFITQPAIPAPRVPEPIKPVVKEPETKLSPLPEPLPVENVIIPEEPQITPEPFVSPIIEEPIEPVGLFLDYYGTICTVPLTEDLSYDLDGVREKNVARVWELLSQDRYLPVIKSCLYWRDELRLSDWGYFKFLEKMTCSFFGTGKRNEARVMQMFILTQSGYQVRIGRSGETLFLLLPFDAVIYEYSYLLLDGIKFYIMDKQIKNDIFVLDHNYPNTKPLSIQILQEPKLAMRKSMTRSFSSKRYPQLSVEIYTNLNLIDFYNDCPLNSQWNWHVQASLSQSVKEQLLPTLHKCTDGKPEVAIANILLDFVQTAFDYKTDDAQFGYERPLYADETLYYPYCDCEDRSILYTILMRELGLSDIVLLHYSDHIATAVHFNEDVRGDYLMLDGKKYFVCDPTYINSSVGDAMPKYRNEKAEIIKVNF